MAFIPVPNTAQVELVFTRDTDIVENVFHVRKPSAWSQVQLLDLCSLFTDWWHDFIRPLVSGYYILNTVRARDMSAENGVGVELAADPPMPGALNIEALPSNVTVAVKWTTGLTGRSYRGRTYHIGLTDPQVSGNLLASTTRASLQSGYQALLTGLTTFNVDYRLVVVSKYHNNAPRVTGVATDILSCSIDPVVDSQRRRLPGRGR